jgi:hypothetical protein
MEGSRMHFNPSKRLIVEQDPLRLENPDNFSILEKSPFLTGVSQQSQGPPPAMCQVSGGRVSAMQVERISDFAAVSHGSTGV